MKLTGGDLFLFWVLTIGFVVAFVVGPALFVYGLKHGW